MFAMIFFIANCAFLVMTAVLLVYFTLRPKESRLDVTNNKYIYIYKKVITQIDSDDEEILL